MRYLFVLLFLTGIAHAQVRQPNVDSDLSCLSGQSQSIFWHTTNFGLLKELRSH